MKRFLGIGIMVAMVLCGSAAFAQDTTVSIGVKAWSNQWEQTVTSGGESDSVKSDKAILMLGPSLNIRFDKVFIGGSYLKSMDDYTFTYEDTFLGYSFEAQYIADRADTDLTFGYMISPQFGLYVGYKSLTSNTKLRIAIPQLNIDETEDFSKVTLSGPGIGVQGFIPLGETAVLYGNLSYMSLDYKETYSDGSEASTSKPKGAAFEVGLAFSLSQSVSANVGFKAQSFSDETEEEVYDPYTDTYVTEKVKSENKFSGITGGITYTF